MKIKAEKNKDSVESVLKLNDDILKYNEYFEKRRKHRISIFNNLSLRGKKENMGFFERMFGKKIGWEDPDAINFDIPPESRPGYKSRRTPAYLKIVRKRLKYELEEELAEKERLNEEAEKASLLAQFEKEGAERAKVVRERAEAFREELRKDEENAALRLKQKQEEKLKLKKEKEEARLKKKEEALLKAKAKKEREEAKAKARVKASKSSIRTS